MLFLHNLPQHYFDAIMDELNQTCTVTVTDADVVYRLLQWHYMLHGRLAQYTGEHIGEAVGLVNSVLLQYKAAYNLCWLSPFFCRWYNHFIITPDDLDVLSKHLHEVVIFPAGMHCQPRCLFP